VHWNYWHFQVFQLEGKAKPPPPPPLIKNRKKSLSGGCWRGCKEGIIILVPVPQELLPIIKQDLCRAEGKVGSSGECIRNTVGEILPRSS